MDALEQYLKIEKVDPTTIDDGSITHKKENWDKMGNCYTEVETSGESVIKGVDDVRK